MAQSAKMAIFFVSNEFYITLDLFVRFRVKSCWHVFVDYVLCKKRYSDADVI